ncbi:MAG: DsrE family protein [Agarilytica sp.]
MISKASLSGAFFFLSMKFSVVVNASPELPASRAALQFCHAIIAQTHSIHRVFFLNEGVLNAHIDQAISNDWAEFFSSNNCDAACCTASCQTKGLADTLGGPSTKIHPAFTIAGLGQLVEASLKSDRLITFGQRVC